MNYYRLSKLFIASILILTGCTNNSSNQISLSKSNWDSFNKTQIEKLLNTYGKNGPDYDSTKPPYVVFDWDNTSIFLDIEEAVIMYQAQNLKYGVSPSQLGDILRSGIDTTVILRKANLAGEKFTINEITKDIVGSYTWLCNNYKPLSGKGQMSLEKIKQTPDYKNFVAKMRFLYDVVDETFSDSIAYPWITYLFAGFDSSQVRALTRETVEWQITQPISIDTLVSPALSNQLSGQVKVIWKNGLRLMPEMQDLYAKFREAGFDVWVCSASFVDVIKEISSNPQFGYNNDINHVLAMELERDDNGKILPVFRKGYQQTQGEGKTINIKRFLADPVTGKYGYQPTFVAGDSPGDENMLEDFDSLKLGLIINRLKDKYDKAALESEPNKRGIILGNLYRKAIESYHKQNAKYLLQGRDDNSGKLIPSQKYIKFGATEGKLFSDE